MKNWKIITTIAIALFFAGIVSAYSQDTTSRSSTDSLEAEINDVEKEIEVMAQRLQVLLEKLGDKTSKQVEEEVTREIKEAMEELEDELKELEEELEEEKRERDEDDPSDSAEGLGEILDGLDITFSKKKDNLNNVKTRWFLVDLGFASYVAPNALPEINGINPMEPDIINSVSWNLHVLNQRINIIRHHLNLVYGAGFSFNFYGFSNPSTLVPSSPDVVFTLPDDNSVSFKKNHLRAAYLHLPVMLNIETNPYRKSKSFHLNAGLYGNVLLGGKTSQKTNNSKNKIKGKYNLENFQYGVLAQIGYGPVTFYGTYGLNELFKPEKDNGYTVNPITFGIRVIPF